ncbi:mannose-1-phosphate guanylyltransferase [Aureimonas sp. SA4125]|uniref:nucleotidyltransferase family protein n=1 Tax=Aureimonas sp. SA4125 TaxID=2826993 RepID=UPI001CC7BDA2|nr:nucleotidyltransferase family protein [Aureimonas sp. SA4125]BDA83933.1 mannose-1-phosphate guanylyltransferase [Aureimonas sp. SA4125]
MRALLLAAGLGTRLRPLTLTVPKCLVEIHGRPLLDYWLEHIFSAGIERALINTHWLPDAVRSHVQASHFAGRIDLVYEADLLGTAGTVGANAAWLGDDPFLLVHADNLTDFDVRGFIRRHQQRPSHCAITMLAFRTDVPKTCGILGLDCENVVTSFHEKVENPPGNLANAAVYLCEPEVVRLIRSLRRPVVDFSTEVIPAFMGRILAVETNGYHRDIGSPEALALAEREFVPMPGFA